MTALWVLGVAFLEIALHRRGPESLPPSTTLLGLAAVAYVAVNLIGAALVETSGRELALFAIQTVLFIGIVQVLLHFVGKPERFLPAATALIGTGAVLSLIALPLVMWDARLDAPLEQLTAPRFLYIVMLFWSLDVGGFILSRALDRPYVVGVFIMIGYELVSWGMRDSLLAAAV